MGLTPGHLALLLVVVVLLFGAKKLPDAARSIGRSLRIFKSEVQELNDGDSTEQGEAQQAIQPQQHKVNQQQQPGFVNPQQPNYQQQQPGFVNPQQPNYQQNYEDPQK